MNKSFQVLERVAGQWQPIAYADDIELAQQLLAEIEAFYPTPEGTERYRIVNCADQIPKSKDGKKND